MALAEERIQAKGPIRDIYEMLDARETEIRSQQAEHDSLLEQQNADCEEEYAFRADEINDGSLAAEAADSHRAKCTNSKAEAERNRAERAETLEEKRAERQRLEDIRIQERQIFGDRKRDHEQAITALDAAEHLFAEQSELLTPAQIQLMSVNFLRHSIKTKSTQMFAPLMAALAQLTATPGELRGDHSKYFETKGSVNGRLGSVEEMIHQLKTNFESSLNNYTNIEVEAEKAW